jgi:alcohol dehydrogenase, propanol-preferring
VLQPAINSIFDRLEHGAVAGRVVLDFLGVEQKDRTASAPATKKLGPVTAV